MFRADLLGGALLGATLLGAGSALATRTAAQGVPPLVRGAPVRVVRRGDWGEPLQIVQGRFILLANDSVTIDVGDEPGRPRLQTFTLHSPWQFQVRSEGHSRGGTGAAVGGLLGAAVGAYIGATSCKNCDGGGWGPNITSADAAVLVGLVGGAAGSLVGFVVGSQVHTTTWVSLFASEIHITLGPAEVGLHAEF